MTASSDTAAARAARRFAIDNAQQNRWAFEARVAVVRTITHSSNGKGGFKVPRCPKCKTEVHA